jgi:hypothetical protein
VTLAFPAFITPSRVSSSTHSATLEQPFSIDYLMTSVTILFSTARPRTTGTLGGLERMIESQLVATGQAVATASGVVPAKVQIF